MKSSSFLTVKWIRASIIGALYFALTVVIAPLSFGPVQVRVSELLTVLPFFFPEAIWGLTIGCLLANLFSPFGIVDIVGGTLCTFIAAYLTYLCRHIPRKTIGAYISILPPILINGFGVSFYVTSMAGGAFSVQNFSFPLYFSIAGSILLGEAISVGIGGSMLITYLLHNTFNVYNN